MNTQIALTVELRLLAYAVFICIVMWLVDFHISPPMPCGSCWHYSPSDT